MKPAQDPQISAPPPGYFESQAPPVQLRSKDNYGPSAPAPAPGLNPPGGTIIYTSTTVSPPSFGPYPMRYTCPNCNAHVMTETSSTPGALTYILSGALCFLAGYLLCCLIPCCVRECKDIEHRCPNCHYNLGLFKRI